MDSLPHPYGRIAHELAGSPFSAITYVAETGSTNADAASLLGSEEHLGRSIVAEHQRRGQGRNGRSWTSLPGTALLVTTILPRSVDSANVWAVPFWVALAVRGALSKRGIRTALHWPNDLLIEGGGKVAGILCTSRITAGTAWVACGVGINVHRRHGGETGLNPPPAFCDDVAHVDRAQLLLAVLREYETALRLLADPPSTAAQWEEAAGLPGTRYRIVKDGEAQPFEAIAVRLGAGGELVVDRGDGRIESVSFADARALR